MFLLFGPLRSSRWGAYRVSYLRNDAVGLNLEFCDIVARRSSSSGPKSHLPPSKLAETVEHFRPIRPPIRENPKDETIGGRSPPLDSRNRKSHVHRLRPAQMNAVPAFRGTRPTNPPPRSPVRQRRLAPRARERQQPGQPIQLDPIPCFASCLLHPRRQPDATAAETPDGTAVAPDGCLCVPAARQFTGLGVPMPGPSADVGAIAFRAGGSAGLEVEGGFRVGEAALLGTRLLGDGVRFVFFDPFGRRASSTHIANLGGTDPALGFAAILAGVDP